MTVLRGRLVLLALGPLCALVTSPAMPASGLVHAAMHRGLNSTSSNWSGYASTSGPFTSVSASWVQPSVTCNKKASYSSFWVGLDGDGSNTVEQTGSEADCRNGRPAYYSWYEMYPAYPVNYSNTVKPGDTFNASVTYSGSGSFTLTLADKTQGWSQTQNKTSTVATRYSAEIIAEAPSSGGRVLPLADFGTVQFSSALANGAAIGGQNADDITMASGATVKAKPSGLTGGENFSVQWEHS